MMVISCELKALSCGECGVIFAVPTLMMQVEPKNVFCPNGHQQTYRIESEVDKLKKQLQAAESSAAEARCEQLKMERKLERIQRQAKRKGAK